MISSLMRQLLFTASTILALTAVSSANCYVLQNNTSYTQTWHFQYNTPITTGQITQLQMQPHGRYPASGQWCWNNTGGFRATVLVDNGAYRATWHGPFVMGDGSGFSPSGTYSLNPVHARTPDPQAHAQAAALWFEPCDACQQRCRYNCDACVQNVPTNEDPEKQQERRAICDNNYTACMDDCSRNSCNSGVSGSSDLAGISRPAVLKDRVSLL